MISPKNIDAQTGSVSANLDEALTLITQEVGALRSDLNAIQGMLANITPQFVQELQSLKEMIVNLNLLARIVALEEKVALSSSPQGMAQALQDLTGKVESLQNIAFDQIDKLINFPEVVGRIQALETTTGGLQQSDMFVYIGQEKLLLPGAAMNALIISCDGVDLTAGVDGDYVLLEDKQTVKLQFKPIEGSIIRCKYY